MHKWQDMKGEVAKVRPYLAECFDNFYQSLSKNERSDLTVSVVTYDYGKKIIKDGRPIWQGGISVPENYLIDSILPFGIIIENSCEVLEYTIGVNEMAQVPQAIISQGDAIGFFETLDYLTSSTAPSRPDWTITAGASSIHTLSNLATQDSRKKLEMSLGERIDDLALEDHQTLIGQLLSLNSFQSIRKDWQVRIMYFSNKWFELLKCKSRPEIASESAMRLTLELSIRSWRNLAKIRDGSDLQHDRLFEASAHRKASHAVLISAADKFLKKAADILISRRPCYIPTREDTELGPFAKLSSEILQHVSEHNSILCPGYLSDELNVGYLKLEHLNPTIVDGSGQGGIAKKVEQIISIIRSALRKGAQSDDLAPILEKNRDIFQYIMFRTPASGPGNGAGQSIFKIEFTKNYLNNDPKQLDAEAFFAPYFEENTLPNERCAFFKNSVRFQKR